MARININGYWTTFAELEKKYGTVKHNNTILYLTQNAYAENYSTNGAIRYYANAIDEDNNNYKVTWNTTEEWDNASEEYKKTEEYSPLLDDESNACDWDDPIEIDLI